MLHILDTNYLRSNKLRQLLRHSAISLELSQGSPTHSCVPLRFRPIVLILSGEGSSAIEIETHLREDRGRIVQDPCAIECKLYIPAKLRRSL